MSVTGHLHEVFASFQGEGTHVGRWQTFVRTSGCPLRCRYCDTPKALVPTKTATLHAPDGPVIRPNPVTPELVATWVDTLDPSRDGWVSLTGGEPLDQPEFLAAVVDALRPRKMYLETAGVHADAVAGLEGRLDVVAFDLKLDSVAREGDRSEEHRAFLAASRHADRVAKVIFSASVDLDELESMARMVADEDEHLPFILQPETPRDGSSPRIPMGTLEAAFSRARAHLRDVRLIPQTHRFLSVP